MSFSWRGVVLGLGVIAMGGIQACGKSKLSSEDGSNGNGGAEAGARGGGGSADQAGRSGGPGGGGDGSGTAGSDAGGSGGADAECRDDELSYAPGCNYAPLPAEGCYASCADEPCTRGECLAVSVPTRMIDGIIFPDATCGERHALCVDAPLCVAAAQIAWDYISASSNSVVMRSRIDAEAGPEGELRLFDLTGGDYVKVCAVELPPCASEGVDLDDVNRAVANPEMQEILRGGGLYGYRGDNGAVLRLVADPYYIEVGEPCDGRTGCRDIEPSIDALATMLRGLTEAALLDARCSGAPPLP